MTTIGNTPETGVFRGTWGNAKAAGQNGGGIQSASASLSMSCSSHTDSASAYRTGAEQMARKSGAKGIQREMRVRGVAPGMDLDVKAGEYLKELRKQHGLSLRQVVDLSAGLLDKTTISRIEKNARVPSLRAVYAFSKIYSAKMDDIAALALGKPSLETPDAFAFSAREKDIILRYRRLTKKNRQLFAGLVDSMSKNAGAQQPLDESPEQARKILEKSLE